MNIYTLGLLYLIIFSKVLPIESHLINAFQVLYLLFHTVFNSKNSNETEEQKKHT
jgi:hypothetical protein